MTDPVSLKVLSWNVAGLAEDCTDIFLSQISMLADWDVLLLQEYFRKLDGVNVGAHELFTPSELMGGLRCPAVIVNRKRKGQSKIVGSAARWTAVELDGQLTLISAHLPHKGRKLGEFEATLTELQEFLNGRPKQHVILGGDFNVNLFGMTDYLHVGESIPRPRTLIDTNDSLRARALHTMVTELDLTVTNTWMNADTERELFTRSSWSNPEDSLTQMDFIMTSRKLEMKHVQVLDSDWFKTDHRAVYAVLSLRPKMRYTMRNAANLRGWVPDESWHDVAAATLTDWKSWNKLAPLLVETAKAHRRVESKEMSVTEMELKTLLLRKKKTGRYLERSELNWLCREIWRKRRALKREKHLDKIKESAEMGRAPKKTQSKHFNWKSIAKDENPESVLTKYFRDLYSISEEQEELTQSERRHWVELWKNMRIDCTGGMLISPKKLENVLKKLKNGKGSPDQITADVLKALPPRMFGKAGEVVVADVLEHGFPGRLAVFVDGDGSECGGCNVLDQVHCWTVCDAKSLGLRLAQVTPSTEIRKCANCVCTEDTRRCWSVSAVEGGGTVSRVAERDCSGTAGREESVRPCGPSSGLQGNEIARCELVLDGLDCGNLEWKLHEGMLGNGDIKQSSDEPRIASRSAESPVIFTMIMELVLRDLIKSWISRKLAWRLDDFTLAAICYADDVVLIAVSVSAAETMVSEVIEKLKDVGLTVGAQKTHWTSFPKMVDKNITVDGSAVVWEEVLEFVGSMVCLDGNARHAIAHRTAQANKCRAKWKLVLNSPWLPRLLRLNIVKTTMWQAFSGARVSGRRSRHRGTKLRAGAREWWRMLLE